MRAFHIMDPKGVLDTLFVFHEMQGSIVPQPLQFSVDAEVSLYIATLKKNHLELSYDRIMLN